MSISNGIDELYLENAGGIIDVVIWDDGATFPDPNGNSMALDPAFTSAVGNDVGTNWCEGQGLYGAYNSGTPGPVNDSCAIVQTGHTGHTGSTGHTGLAVVPADLIGVGDIIVSEIMQNPAAASDNLGEYFEIYNTTAANVDLEGLSIRRRRW